MKKFTLLAISALLLASCTTKPTTTNSNNNPSPTKAINKNQTITMKPSSELLNLQPGQKIFATLKTTLGEIKIELFDQTAPKTVGNFVGLAEGTQPWKDPKTGALVENKPFYNGLIFHRVIPSFMIQGGDPLGIGTGGPGYKFEDEISTTVAFDKPYLLAMANSGPNTNGSQFFITAAPTTWLNGIHTIFGVVVTGSEVVDAIATTPKNANDLPLTPVVINEVVITRE